MERRNFFEKLGLGSAAAAWSPLRSWSRPRSAGAVARKRQREDVHAQHDHDAPPGERRAGNATVSFGEWQERPPWIHR